MFLRERSELNECWSQHWKALLSSLLGKDEVVEALVTDWETEVMSNSIAENFLGTTKNPPSVIAALLAMLQYYYFKEAV